MISPVMPEIYSNKEGMSKSIATDGNFCFPIDSESGRLKKLSTYSITFGEESATDFALARQQSMLIIDESVIDTSLVIIYGTIMLP